MKQTKEWKITKWWQKTLLTIAMIQGAISAIVYIYYFIVGFAQGLGAL